MEFQNGKSIFSQIGDRITDQIVNGELQPGKKIPSIRDLAEQMGVNPHTIMRSYNELQALKIIENQRGIGYFVGSKALDIILEGKRDEFFSTTLPNFLKVAGQLGISNDELKKYIDKTRTK